MVNYFIKTSITGIMSLFRLANEDSKINQGGKAGSQFDIGVYRDPQVLVDGPNSAMPPRDTSLALDYLNPPEIDAKFQSLLVKARCACEKSKVEFRVLSTVQRKFVTHYRCPQCGLLPLYHLDLTHPKRVRCGKCRHTVPLRNSGKYGRLRKEIAIELWLAGQERGEHYHRK